MFLIHVPGLMKASRIEVRSTPERADQLEACLQSLAFRDMDFRFHDVHQAKSGTCNWVLQDEVYAGWYSSPRGLLWINGKPGSGKSTALKYILRHMKIIRPPDHKILYLTFFFHGRGSELQRTLQGLFRSLMHQLLSQAPDACHQIVSEYSQKCKSMGEVDVKWHWHTPELEEHFRISILKALDTRKVILGVDALDESGKDTALRVVNYFKLLLQNLSHDSESRLQICFTCRHYPILDRVSEFTMRFEEGNTADIEAFVQSQLSESQKLRDEGFVQLITKRANGVFLWAKLKTQQALEMDSYGQNSEAIKTHLHTTSSELEEIYDDLLRSLENKRLALRLFYWVAFSLRGLSLDELRWPMTINMNDSPRPLRQYEASNDYVHDSDAMASKLVYLGRGLVEIVSSDKPVVQFIHETARQYIIDTGFKELLTSIGTPLAKFGSNEMYEIHHMLAKTCLRYLAAKEVGDLATTKSIQVKQHHDGSLFSFLEYAKNSWLVHALRGEKVDNYRYDLLDDFGWSAQKLLSHCTAGGNGSSRRWHALSHRGYNLLHLLVALELPKALEIAIGRSPCSVNQCEMLGCTPIALAARLGSLKGMKVLVDSGQVDFNCRNAFGHTPLALAAIGCHDVCIRFLLQATDADVNARDNNGLTALLCAAGELAVSTDAAGTVKALLSAPEVDVNAANRSGMTALVVAAAQGNIEVLKGLLATAKVNVNVLCEKGRTPLHHAITSWKPWTAILLAGCPRVDVNVRDINGTTPLMLAAEQPRLPASVARHLINCKRIDLNVSDNHGATALSKAAQCGNIEVTRLLLEAGVKNLASKETIYQGSGTTTGGINRSSLSAINRSRRLTIDSKDHNGRTPLLYAAKIRSLKVTNLLLEAGADCKGFKISSYFLRNGWKVEKVRNRWVAAKANKSSGWPIR